MNEYPFEKSEAVVLGEKAGFYFQWLEIQLSGELQNTLHTKPYAYSENILKRLIEYAREPLERENAILKAQVEELMSKMQAAQIAMSASPTWHEKHRVCADILQSVKELK